MIRIPLRTPATSHLEPLEARITPSTLLAISVDSLGAGDGFLIAGEADAFDTGARVDSAGDLNGDGFDDLIVQRGDTSGRGYVVFGRASGSTIPGNLAALDGTNGFRIDASPGDSGLVMRGAGDVNGDGLGDLLVGVRSSDLDGTSSGAAFVVFGRSGTFDAAVSLSALDGSDGFKVRSEAAGDRLGGSVAAAGDVNGDGIDDLIVGATGADPGGDDSGAAYVVFGRRGTFADTLALSTLDGTTGFKIPGRAERELLGASVRGAGDLNGDGLGDLLIESAPFDTNGNVLPPVTYVLFGRDGGFAATVDLGALDSTTGFALARRADSFGSGSGPAGDLNGDGLGDWFMNVEERTPAGTFAGVTYVIFGRSAAPGAGFSLASLNGLNGFKIAGAGLGLETFGGGDVNGDGYADLLVTAEQLGGNASGVIRDYVILGKAGSFGKVVNPATLTRANAIVITGEPGFAGSALGTGDFNGDGLADIVIGDISAGAAENPTGGAAVVFGGWNFSRAALSTGGKSVSFRDADGDLVTVASSKGAFQRTDLRLVAQDRGFVLQRLDVRDSARFQGANLTITAQKIPGGTGDGLAGVGAIDATGIDLGTVAVSGDLGQIDAGDATPATPAIRSLIIGSLGDRGATTQPAGTVNPLRSELAGGLGSLVVRQDLAGFIAATGPIGPVTVGDDFGSTRGDADGGGIQSTAGIGAVTVGDRVLGYSDGMGIFAGGKLGKVTIRGGTEMAAGKRFTLAAVGKPGAAGADAIAIAAVSVGGQVGRVAVGDVSNTRIIAGFDPATGAVVNAGAGIGPVTIGKSFANSVIRATGVVGPVTIGGDLDGSAGGTRSGLIEGRAGVGAVTIKGSIVGGADFTGILSGGKLGKVAVGQSIAGPAGKPVTIAALGRLGATTAADAVAFAGLAVGRDVANARILAGYDVDLGAQNPDASIGAVTVGRDWTASSLVAGIRDTSVAGNSASVADGFGRNDTRIGGDTTPTLFATITSLLIKGAVGGSASGSAHFGITAEKIGALTLGVAKQTLAPGAVDLPIGPTGNFRLVDFA